MLMTLKLFLEYTSLSISAFSWPANVIQALFIYFLLVGLSASSFESVKVLVAQLCLTLQSHGLQPTGLLYPWDTPGKNIGTDSHSLLQGIFPTQDQTWVYCCLQSQTPKISSVVISLKGKTDKELHTLNNSMPTCSFQDKI